MVKTPILTRGINEDFDEASSGFYETRHDDGYIAWALCARTVKEAFGVPSEATRVQFQAYKRPKEGRIKVTFFDNFMDCLVEGLTKPQSFCEWTDESISKLAKGETEWYVEAYYWVD